MRPARPSPGLPKEKPSLKLKHAHKHSLSTHPLHVSTSTIAEKDRKRYEGVWAANRGYLMHTLALPPDEMAETLAEGVHPLVVRELWGRSRLGREMLAEVWRLVDRGGKGWLGREEFVVGMWLVDRGLEGRKAPMGGVGGGVWGSARRLGG
ncbi:hypothetical protein EV426DRAFT_536872 [Tirmania nivea]|nr:hypothetical protein EV426DRAFT_536872 [Tirmania nivea]